MSFLRRIWRYILGLPRLYSIGGAVIVIAIMLIVAHAATRSTVTADTTSTISHVKISSVASLSSAAGPLPVTGKVTSLNQATILAQSSGEITSLNIHIGSQVGAGQVIAQFENSSQQASLLQAQGSYEAAQAALAKATGSTAANAGINSGQAATAAQNSIAWAQAALQSTYAALDDAVHAKADAMFSNPRQVSPQFTLTVPDGQLVITLQNERGSLEGTLADAKRLSNDPNPANIDQNALAINADAQLVITFLTNLVQAVNEAISTQNIPVSTIATYQTSAGAARSEVVNAVSTLASQKTTYDATVAGAQTASNSANNGNQNDVASAQANVKQALGALHSAQANLEKTVVRSPISGTIVTLPVTRGDFVATFAQVAEVSNPGALEVAASVTPDDAKTLAVGGKATIDTTVQGVITSIAPALDPSTGKILVKIGIVGSAKLTDGETVTVSLLRTTEKQGSTVKTDAAILIPIAAAKITPGGAVVFTVASSTLSAHPIVLSTIVGSQITVTSGLTLDMDIVTDARGLTDGQVVVVDSQ